jgi:hypothetical protein
MDDTGCNPVNGYFGKGTEFPAYLKSGIFLEQLNNSQLLKDSFPYSCLYLKNVRVT